MDYLYIKMFPGTKHNKYYNNDTLTRQRTLVTAKGVY